MNKSINQRAVQLKYSSGRRSLVFALLVLLMFSGTLFAQGSGNKYAGEFLAIGVGGRQCSGEHK